jgi:hypothetical protein
MTPQVPDNKPTLRESADLGLQERFCITIFNYSLQIYILCYNVIRYWGAIMSVCVCVSQIQCERKVTTLLKLLSNIARDLMNTGTQP